MTRQFTVVDLFCGAGGLSLGFERAGFSVLAAYDNWKPATQTYRRNISDKVHDVSVTGELDVPDATVIIGGPPCQGFSSAGMRRLNDDRNTLIAEFSQLVARKKPLAFVFENVEGFLTGARGRFILDLLDPLIEAGYQVHVRKLNAANYGVPQHRKRVIAIGGLGWEPDFPTVTHCAFGAPGSYLANSHGLPLTPTLEEALRDLPPATLAEPAVPDHVYTPLEGSDLTRAKLLRPGQRMRDLPEKLWHKSYRRRAFRRVKDGTPSHRRGGAPAGVLRLRADEPCKTITSGALREFLHPSKDRTLTIRECAILQTFPREFTFQGSKSEKMQLIGNAVPPLLAHLLATSLYSGLLHATPVQPKGRLLSFAPTLSTGMSPALANVLREVNRRYGMSRDHEYHELLWR